MDKNKVLMLLYSEKLLNLALKTNKLKNYLVGEGIFDLKMETKGGLKINNYFLVMEAIYKKYKEKKQEEIDKKVYDAMLKILKTTTNEMDVYSLMLMIEYQMYSEKVKYAPFELDNNELLKELKNNIERNKEIYMQSQSISWSKFEEHNQILETKFGCNKIL